jgi:hypothetical protein
VGRLQTGFTLAGLALTAAVFAQGCPPLAAFFVVLTVLICVATMADRLPWLHTLPGIGAPGLESAFTLEGRSKLEVRMPPPYFGHPPSGSALLVVGVKVAARVNVDAFVTVVFSAGLHPYRSDKEGRRVEGKWGSPTGELADEQGRRAPYWHTEMKLRGGVWNNILFRVRPDDKGTFPVRLKVSANALYEDFQADAEVSAVVRQEERPWDVITDAIHKGEELRADLADKGRDFFVGPSWPDKRMTTLELEARDAVPEELHYLFDRDLDYEGAPSGRAYQQARLEKTIAVLYEARRNLGG